MSTETDAETDISSKRNVTRLFGRRRQNLDRDGHVTGPTHIDDDGHKIEKIEYEVRSGETETREYDLTALLGAAPSTTTRTELIIQEAQLVEDTGRTDLNPHIPSNDDVLEKALDVFKDRGLVPAWEVIDGNAEVMNE